MTSTLSSGTALPLVAIVGRPNVGKSRFFNRLTRSRKAIVENTPGVTRDRHYGEAEWEERVFNLVDTGGFEPETTDELLGKMREQAELAIAEADIVVALFDGRAGPVKADWEMAELLRRSGKPIFWVVNKIDAESAEPLVAEFFELGISPVYAVSAEHGRGMDELMEVLTAEFPKASDVAAARDSDEGEEGVTHIAVIGRPNVGKSTLVNRLVGQERLLTSDVPGTTRDAIDTALEQDGQRFVLIDTAGVRRRRSISLELERFSVVRAFHSVDRADVVLFLLDGQEGPTDQDARLLGLVADKGRAIVLLVNKWDAVEKDEKTADTYAKALRETLNFVDYARVEFISAKTGQRVNRVLPAALEAKAQWRRRIPTSELNAFLAQVVARNQPPIHRNRRVKLYYMTQARTAPPTFVIMASAPKGVAEHYQRYLVNQLRAAYGFQGSPIRLRVRQRERRGDEAPARRKR
jgi:GTPase